MALSSRNAYLSPAERDLAAPTLYAALQEARHSWEGGSSKFECVIRARELVRLRAEELAASSDKIEMRLDYVELNDPDTFELLPDETTRVEYAADSAKDEYVKSRPVILSGAMWVGKTRLIDNVVLGDVEKLGIAVGEP